MRKPSKSLDVSTQNQRCRNTVRTHLVREADSSAAIFSEDRINIIDCAGIQDCRQHKENPTFQNPELEIHGKTQMQNSN